MYCRRPDVWKGTALPWAELAARRSWSHRAHSRCSVSNMLVTFQNINLLLIKACLSPRKLRKYVSILLIWETSNRLYKPAAENPGSIRKTKCSENFCFFFFLTEKHSRNQLGKKDDPVYMLYVPEICFKNSRAETKGITFTEVKALGITAQNHRLSPVNI